MNTNQFNIFNGIPQKQQHTTFWTVYSGFLEQFLSVPHQVS